MPDVLHVEGLRAGYGEAIIIDGIGFTIGEGRSLALLGRNGTGKTTLLCTLVGATRRRAGRIELFGEDVTRMRSDQRAAAGIGWVPQERNIFKSLTVEENLTAIARPGRWTVKRVYEMFPRLEERKRNLGTQLSGGEQQMLAIGRALVLNPRLLLLDEPCEGLAPLIVEELLRALERVVHNEGLSAIFVEQNPARILPITDTAIVLERGTVVHSDTSEALLADRATLDHGCNSPLSMLWPHQPDWPGALVPIEINVLQYPLPTARRCYTLGQAVRRAVESYPEDLDVVIVGTGGLSHQIHGERTGFNNTEWDMRFLDLIERDPEALTRMTHAEYVRQGGAEGVEVIMWLAMRGALSNRIRKLHQNYYLPMTTAMTVVLFEEPDAAGRSAVGSEVVAHSRS